MRILCGGKAITLNSFTGALRCRIPGAWLCKPEGCQPGVALHNNQQAGNTPRTSPLLALLATWKAHVV